MKSDLLKYLFLTCLTAGIFVSCEKDDEKSDKIIVKLGAQSNTSIGAFYSVGEDKVYTQALAFNNQDTIDMLCFYEVTDARQNYTSISSPGGGISGIYTGETSTEVWTTKKLTKFTDPVTAITPAEFDQLENEDAVIASYFDNTVTSGFKKRTNLQVDDIYAFKTQDGITGLFKVTEVVGGNDGYLEIELKIKSPSK